MGDIARRLDAAARRIVAQQDAAARRIVAQQDAAARRIVAQQDAAARRIVAQQDAAARRIVAQQDAAARRIVAQQDAAARRMLEQQDTIARRILEQQAGIEWDSLTKLDEVEQMVDDAWLNAERVKGEVLVVSDKIVDDAWLNAERVKGDMLNDMRTKRLTANSVNAVRDNLNIVRGRCSPTSDRWLTALDLVIRAIEILQTVFGVGI